VFDFSDKVATLKESRIKPQISTSSVWLSAFAIFTTRRRSLNAIETLLAIPKQLDNLIGPHKPGADTIGRVCGLNDAEPLRMMLCHINHQLGRNKALENNRPMRIVAFDGHEFSSQPTSLLQPMSSTENLSRLRRITLNLLKEEKTVKVGIKGKRLKAGWDEKYLLKALKI